MTEAVSTKKHAHKAMYRNSTEENKAKKTVPKAMRGKAEEALTEI